MAGFLDKKDTIIDMVLTNDGKKLYSSGKLKFVYYTFSDDEVDYDPIINNSSSLSMMQLTASKIDQIENSLVREAVTGYELSHNLNALDNTNIYKVLFSMPQGQKIIPKEKFIPNVASGTLSCKQRKLSEVHVKKDQFGKVIEFVAKFDRGFEKDKATNFVVDHDIEDFFDSSKKKGFDVKLFVSGAYGYTEVKSKKDLRNVISFSNDLIFYIDYEVDRVNVRDNDFNNNEIIRKADKNPRNKI